MTENLRLLVDIRQEQGSVFLALDSGEVFELAPGSVPQTLPEIGESISSPLLAEIQLAAERKQVARRIFAMLDRRLQPVARLRDKLLDSGYSPESVTGVLDQMKEQGLYSDRQFAEAYCRDCLISKAVGRRYLEKKLWEKRVAKEIAASVPGEILDLETEKELALTAAEAKWNRERSRDRRKAEIRITRYLTGRGFPLGVAIEAVRQTAPDPAPEAASDPDPELNPD